MKSNLMFFLLLTCFITTAQSQIVIKMRREGGVSTIPCKVNGLDLNFIFDTGASDVSISMAEATFMFKNGYLQKGDIVGTTKYLDAVGNINEGITINLKVIEIAGLKLFNVKASVVKNNKAPLLLGQSAIGKLGKVQLDFSSNTLTILSGSGQYDYSKNPIQIQEGNDELQVVGRYFRIGDLEVRDRDLGVFNWSGAMNACRELGLGWRLPTIDELNLLYKYRNKINFETTTYWSSTEDSKQDAWILNFLIGNQIAFTKNATYRVRAVKTSYN